MTGVASPAALGALPVRTVYLHRPKPPEGALTRSHLHTALERGLERPVTMVLAPAGFGKSIAVSQWCESIDRPVAWLSLDAPLDSLRWFVMYLVAAVRTSFADALKVTGEMATSGQLPGEDALVKALSNELGELPEPMVLVLDDYHMVTASAVHRMMSELLGHPGPSIHFVVISRYEPPLPIATLRARGQLSDLRMADLAFSENEVQQFAAQSLQLMLDDGTVHTLHEMTEGWPAGVRLGLDAISIAGAGEVVGPGFLDQDIQEYIVAEVLDRVPAQVRRYLIAASRFDRFNAELCEAAIDQSTSVEALMTGVEFIDWIQRHNLFVVSLDDRGEWFRFHHLFARLLDSWRAARVADVDVSDQDVHRAAARVLQAQGWLEEAIEQLTLAGDAIGGARLAAHHGNDLLNDERWPELDRLLSIVPPDVLDNDPALLVLRAWVLGDVRSRHHEMNEVLNRAEALLDRTSGGDDGQGSAVLRGHIAALRGAYAKLISADFDGAVAHAEAARRLLAATHDRSLTFAYVLNVMALAGAGRSQDAHRLARSTIGDKRFSDAPFDPIAWALPFLGWIEGDLAAVDQYATQLLAIGERFGLRDTIASAHYFLGASAYEQNRLHAAEQHLGIVLDLRYATQSINPVHAGMALALTRLAQGREDDADVAAQSMMRHVIDTRSEYLQPVADAFLAALDVRRGRLAAALRWARRADPEAERHRFMFFDPAPALVETLLSSNADADAARGGQLLRRYLDMAQRRHHRPLTIRLLGVDALRLAGRGDEERALEALATAVGLSQQGGMVRRLADLGPGLTPLLHRLDVSGHVLAHVGEILAAITTEATADELSEASVGVRAVAGEPALTARELDVLRLLADRYTNKEIARALFIAPSTVKKHTLRLYDKLNVHGRREVVSKALALGYLEQ